MLKKEPGKALLFIFFPTEVEGLSLKTPGGAHELLALDTEI